MDRSATIFHGNCRLRWNCYNCPVCYYIKNPHVLNNSICMKCNSKDSLWFCILCGHVGCGRSVQCHALEHFQETSHEFVMYLTNFDVWDYKSRQYVHKINDNLGKLDNCHSNKQNNCPCVVCQQHLYPKLLKQPICMKCEIFDVQNLWICLCCHYIGCGRKKNRHAYHHFIKAKHPHVMQLVNFSIWDFKEKKYLHNCLNGSLADRSEFNESGKQLVEKDFVVAELNDSVEEAHSETAAEAGEGASPQKQLSVASKLLQKQPEYIMKRIDLLERQWQEFGNFAEANRKMIEIEKRLVQLTLEKKILEHKLHQHDAK